MLQLDLFKKEPEELLYDEFEKIKESMDKVRRKLFAQQGEMCKLIIDIHNRLEIIEQNICRNKL